MFERGFGAFLAADPNGLAEPGFRLRIRTETPAVPDGLPLVWTGDLPEGGHGRLFETEDRCVLAVSEACVLDIRPGLREADVSLAVDGGRLFMGSASMLLIDLVLLSGNQHLLHAACLTRPGTGGAIVVCGPSGRGKTTTSIALARGGFGLMTDDASVIAFGPDSVHAWGMPRALKVHRYTAALMPWLAPLVGEWGEREEQGVALRDVGPHLHLAPPRPRTLEAVIILGSRRAEGHRLEPISKSEALIEIAVDNIAWFEVGAPQRSAKMFDAMGRALAAVPTYRLHAGPDLDALPAFLDRLLDGASVMPVAP
jgi:hypothetical protein